MPARAGSGIGYTPGTVCLMWSTSSSYACRVYPRLMICSILLLPLCAGMWIILAMLWCLLITCMSFCQVCCNTSLASPASKCAGLGGQVTILWRGGPVLLTNVICAFAHENNDYPLKLRFKIVCTPKRSFARSFAQFEISVEGVAEGKGVQAACNAANMWQGEGVGVGLTSSTSSLKSLG